MDQLEILKIATSIEGHPDNVAPAIFGQATACFMEKENVKMSLVPCADYHCLAIVPRYEVKTSQARKVLPTKMAFKDCVSQVSHALVFIQALQQGMSLYLQVLVRIYYTNHIVGNLLKNMIG